MSAPLVRIADAVVQVLQSAPFSRPVTITRDYRVVVERSDLVQARLSVAPRGVEITPASRGAWRVECVVDVTIQRVVPADSVTEIDAMMTLTDEVVSRLCGAATLPGLPYDVARVKVANDPAYSAEHLGQESLFASVVTAVYQIARGCV